MRKRIPKVLTITPTYEPQKKLLEDVLFNIGNQDYRNYDSLILVNNSSLKYYHYVCKTVNKIEDQLSKNDLFSVFDIGQILKKGDYKGSISSRAYNEGLEYAWKYDYDYALLVPGDIAIPDNCIREMLKPFQKYKDCGVSCLTCYFRWSGDRGFQEVVDKISEVLPSLKGQVDQKVPMLIPLDDKEMNARKYYQKKYLKVRAGDGAMMIPRRVFSEIRMRDHKKDGTIGNDYAYCLDTLERFGLYTYINTTLYTPHLHLDSKQEVVFY